MRYLIGLIVTEIINDDKIAVKLMKPIGLGELFRLPGLPSLTGLPRLKSPILFSLCYEDIYITKKANAL